MSGAQAWSDAPERASRERLLERLCLALVLVVAFVLRTRDVADGFFVGPDEGNYLHSAQIHQIERGFAPMRWVGEDVEWVQHLARNYDKTTVTYQHSYLHQALTRYLYRLGCGALQAVRMSSAITGTLTVLFAWWVFARLWPARRRIGLLAAALCACAPFHVFYSRIGWGQVGFACFYLAYCVVLYRVLFVIDEHDRRAMRRAGWALLALSLLSFGWQEGVAPYIAGCAFVVALRPWIQRQSGDERGWIASVLRSRRTWTWVWSAVPVGAMTVALAVFSAFAQDLWFDPGGLAHLPWLELKRLTVNDIFVSQRVDLQVGWPMLVLAAVGWFAWRRAHKGMATFFAATSGVGAVILFLRFGDAHLLRIYMPVFLVLCLFAAVGLAACAVWVGARAGHAAAAVLVGLVLGSSLFTTWTTLFGRVESPFFVQRLYVRGSRGNLDHRDVDRPILERLRIDARQGERIGVFGDKAAIFRLQDSGLAATEDYLEGPEESWPDWVVGVRKGKDGFDASPRARQYERVVVDTIDRYALYRRMK